MVDVSIELKTGFIRWKYLIHTNQGYSKKIGISVYT